MKRYGLFVLPTLALVLMLGKPRAEAQATGELEIVKRVVVNAPAREVWRVWSTNEGASEFFAPKTNIKAEIGGPYEIFFSPDAAPGQRGAEDLLVHDVEPGKSITFQWNAPPQFPKQRKLRTLVTVTLTEVGQNQTSVELRHHGFGHTEEWSRVHAYFGKAWEYVLGNLKTRFTSGPIKWDKQ
jgi:uncharacterized protein YndB with AHSA1/START domain